jgi:hypothetical protein
MSSRSIQVVLLVLCCPLIWQCTAPAQEASTTPSAGQTGEFTTTFTQHSPLSTPGEIARRLPDKQHPLAAKYDLSTMPFRIYVPKGDDSSQAYGLLIFHCYKPTQDAAPTLHSLLDQHHLIFATSEQLPQSEGVTIGISLDAVFNLEKQYKIDPARVWVMGDTAAEELAFGYPDVFTAGIYRNYEYFRPIKSKQPNSGFYLPKLPQPPAALLAKSKQNHHVILAWPAEQEDEFKQLLPGALRADGFKHVLSITVDTEQYHYPNFKTEWFEKVIDFLDEPGEKPKPAEPLANAHAEPGESANPAEPAPADSSVPSPAAPSDDNSTAGHPSAGASSSTDSSTSADSSTGATTRPEAPTGVPASEDPKKLLNLAKNYIASHAYGPARVRLNLIITKFPSDPAATEARQLLDSLPPQ